MRGNIIVVDDEAGPRESLRMILKPDHNIRTAENGPEALRLIEEDKPDLVFLDLRMPGMDGTEVMKAIKASHSDIEVAIITAYAAVESARLALRLGAVDYLIKPYSVADVEAIVEKALSSRREDHDASVLAAQLQKMTRNLVGQSSALAGMECGDVTEAIDSLKVFQQTLGEDLASVQELYELGEVTAEVSHDVNNLLTVILTSAQFLLERIEGQSAPDRQDVSQWLCNIVRAAKDCTTMLQQIRNYVRSNVNQAPAVIAVNELISSAAELTRDEVASREHEVEFILRLKSVPGIHGDEVALRNVLVNLIENSLDAMEGPGSIELCSEALEGRVNIRVRDDGPGMPPEVLEKATQAFFSTKQSHGTGLGLSIADKVVKRHGGTLSIESALGEGTIITISLPVDGAVEHPVPDAPQTARQTPEPMKATGMVLVVDDQEPMREIMGKMLENEGYSIVYATTGDEGWATFQRLHENREDEPLMVVTDHEMPGLLGRDLAAKVKQLDKDVPVVVVTGYAVTGEGAEDHLVGKPFNIRDFIDPIRDLMEQAAQKMSAPSL